MRRFAGMLVVGALLLMGCGSDSGSTALTEDDLRPMLLTEEEMPDGWVAEPDVEDSDPDEGAPACFQEVRRHTGGDSVPSADAEFSKDPMPFLFESLGYLGDDATQRLEGAFGALDDCDDLELEAADGTMVPGTIAPVDFPSLGDQSRAYRMSFSAQGTTLTFFVVVAQVDEVGVVLGLGTAGEGADTSELELIAEAAVDKVRAGL